MKSSLIERLFHYSATSKTVPNAYEKISLPKALHSIKKIKFTKCFTLLSAWTYNKCPYSDRKRIKIFELGERKLEKSLDVVSLIKFNRILQSMLKLNFTKQ